MGFSVLWVRFKQGSTEPLPTPMAKPGQSMWALVLSPQALEENTGWASPSQPPGSPPRKQEGRPSHFILWLGCQLWRRAPHPKTTVTLERDSYHAPHFTLKKKKQNKKPSHSHVCDLPGEDAEAQRGLVPCPESHSHRNCAEGGIKRRLQVQCSSETPGLFSWTIWLNFRSTCLACLWTSLGRKPGSQ